jgi:hypothetical protein
MSSTELTIWKDWSGQQDSNLRPPAPKIAAVRVKPSETGRSCAIWSYHVHFRFARFWGVAGALAMSACQRGW